MKIKAQCGHLTEVRFASDSTIACSSKCWDDMEKKRFGCCEKARRLDCVCHIAFQCEDHGRKHIGTHD